MKKDRLFFVWAITTLLLVSASSNPSISDIKKYIPSDDQGPEFRDIGNSFHDLLPNETNQANVQLRLSVSLRDFDGVDTVIGSFKDINGTVWSNVTLGLYGTQNDNWLYYTGRGENVTLGPEMRLKVWNVKYYANDSLGNWNVSEVGKSSYYLFTNPEPSPIPVFVTMGALGILGMSILLLIMWRKREN
jgi:hypothetical protein